MASTVWRGFITFGLISIPVRLFRAARAERVSLRRLYRTEAPPPASPSGRRTMEEDENADDEAVAETPPGRRGPPPEPTVTAASAPQPVLTPVQQVSVRKGSDEVLPERSVVKGYEYQKDRYVAIEPEELKAIAPKTATEMQIEEFVNLAEIDPVYFETSYYVVPEEAGQKAYALLFRSLQVAGLVALAQVAMHSREHVVVLRPGSKGLIAHTMFFSSEVRANEEYRADATKVTAKEMDLAQMLIQSLAAPFEPQKYRDSYREKLEALIAQRVAGQPATASAQPAVTASVVDITEALQKSLAALKKPVKSAAQPSEAAKNSQRPRKKAQRAG